MLVPYQDVRDPAMVGCEALETMEACEYSGEGIVRGPQYRECQCGQELGMDGMVNVSEWLQRRHRKQAKDTVTLGPKGTGTGMHYGS